MDALLCDELLQEIFRRLPASSSAAVSLVSKRWLCLLRSSTTSLSLLLYHQPQPHLAPALSSFLSQHPYLSVLSVNAAAAASDHLLRLVASSCPNLSHLRFLAGPVSPFSLFSLSSSCPRLCSLDLALCKPLSFLWLAAFKHLKHLSVQSVAANSSSDFEYLKFSNNNLLELDEFPESELNLESLCLSGIGSGDYCGLTWLWRNCKKITTLKLKSCEGVGDNDSFSEFLHQRLEQVELRSCRPIVNGVLLKLAENCASLNSLLLHDGGCKDGLLQFIRESKCNNLQKLDFRLPLDLDNTHLLALAENNSRVLSSLRLQSCCLVTGEGLKSIGRAVGGGVEELALIKCDVVERESGLLATLGQNMKGLRKLDLSYNEMLVDKELVSMLASCNDLSELKLRGCNKLTNLAMASMAKSCKRLQRVDIRNCGGIEAEGVEQFVVNSARLTRLQVEESKLSSVATIWASNHFIQLN